MFTTFYGMTRSPFDREIAIKYAYESEDFKEVISRMKYLIEIQGMGLFTGFNGVGKTFTARYLKESLNPDLYRLIYITIPKYISLFDFYNILGKELYIDMGNCYKPDIYNKIQDTFRRMVNVDRVQPVIIIDDAQNLSGTILEIFKVFFDFEMDSKDYVALIIIGTDEIKTRIQRDSCEALKSRILVNYTFNGLSREEVMEYVKTRLEIANTTGIFNDQALNALYSCSRSNPRRLNTLITASLLLGVLKKKKIIDEEIIMRAKGEIDL